MRRPRSRNRPIPPMYRVEIHRHAVPPRWIFPNVVVRLPAVNAADARRTVVIWTHGEIGVPRWRPCIRHSMQFASATRTSSPRMKVVSAHQQLSFDERWAA